MNKMKELLKREEAPNQAANLAIKLWITESYVRTLANGKVSPAARLARDIDALYNES